MSSARCPSVACILAAAEGDAVYTPPIDPVAYGTPLIILIDAPTADVSSTAIRQRIAAGESISGLVPARVQQHIERHGLYTSATPGRRAIDAAELPAAGRLHGQE